MALELNPVAVSSGPLLRAIHGQLGDWLTQTELARVAGRDPKNMTRDLSIVRKAGLVAEGEIALTEAGQDQLAALDRAENPTDGLGVTHAFHADLIPDPDQPRKDFTSDAALEDLRELKESLILRGRILQPIAVRPIADESGRFLITDGERRWRAAGWAMEDGDWPHDRPLPITVQDTDAKETRLSQLTANMVRADMTPLEEADAFADLIETHGMTTAGIAAEIGMSQKLVQNRLRLRQLSACDRARMALPEDDPDHLGYKAALKSLMTPRESDPGESGSPADDRHPRESGDGSPAAPPDNGLAATPEPPAFDTTINDREALLLVEIADKAERDPDPDLGSEHYTRCGPDGLHGVAQALVTKGLIGFRQRGMTVLVRPRQFSTPYGEWLTGLGFHQHRADCLFEARAKVHGLDVARSLADSGLYATAWLNPAEPLPDHADGSRPVASAPGAAFAREVIEREGPPPASDVQPHLIEPTEEERQAIAAGAQRAADRRVDEMAIDDFADRLKVKLAQSREKGRRGWNDPTVCHVDDLAASLVAHVSKGDPLDIAAFAMFVLIRAGSMKATQIIAEAHAMAHQTDAA